MVGPYAGGLPVVSSWQVPRRMNASQRVTQAENGRWREQAGRVPVPR